MRSTEVSLHPGCGDGSLTGSGALGDATNLREFCGYVFSGGDFERRKASSVVDAVVWDEVKKESWEGHQRSVCRSQP